MQKEPENWRKFKPKFFISIVLPSEGGQGEGATQIPDRTGALEENCFTELLLSIQDFIGLALVFSERSWRTDAILN